MKTRLFLLYIIVTFSCQLGNSQKLQTTVNSKYLKHGDDIIHVDNLFPILKDKKDPLSHYFSYMNQRKTAKYSGITFLSLLGGGLLLVTVSEAKDCRQRVCITDAEYVGIIAIVVSPFVGLVSLVSGISASVNKDKMINKYNAGTSNLNYKYESISLDLGSTQNGIGLILTF